jgi:siroheme synthase
MSQKTSSAGIGTVYIVGSGPGELDLLTLRAARLIGEADAIVYDHLIAEGVLDLARPEAEKIYAGKESSNHSLPQGELNRLLVRLARTGKNVVRLKGGDPFVFGRGGEEIETLVDAGNPLRGGSLE